MPDGGRDDDDDDAAEDPPMFAQPELTGNGQTPKIRAELRAAAELIRYVAGDIALDLANTPEGRVTGLRVEVCPDKELAVRMEVRTGHELHVFAERREAGMSICLVRIEPATRGRRPQTTRDDLGELRTVREEALRALMTRWLSWRARG